MDKEGNGMNSVVWLTSREENE